MQGTRKPSPPVEQPPDRIVLDMSLAEAQELRQALIDMPIHVFMGFDTYEEYQNNADYLGGEMREPFAPLNRALYMALGDDDPSKKED